MATANSAPQVAATLATYLESNPPVHPFEHQPVVTGMDAKGAQELFQSEMYPELVSHQVAFPKRTRTGTNTNSTLGTYRCELHPSNMTWEELKTIEDSDVDGAAGSKAAIEAFKRIIDQYKILNDAWNKATRADAEAALNELSGGDTETPANKLTMLLTLYHSVEVLTPLPQAYWLAKGVRYEGTCGKCWAICCCCVTYYCTVRDQREESGEQNQMSLLTEVNTRLTQTDSRQLRLGRTTARTGVGHALHKPPSQQAFMTPVRGLTRRDNMSEVRRSGSRNITPEQNEAMLRDPKGAKFNNRTKTGLATQTTMPGWASGGQTWACTRCTFCNERTKRACEMCDQVKDVTVRALSASTDTSARYSTGSNAGTGSSSSDYETQFVPVLKQGNDLRGGAGSGASGSSDDLVMSAVDLSTPRMEIRQRRYEVKLDAMTVEKLKQACRDRSLPVGGVKAVLLKRLKESGNANGKNTAGKGKRKETGGKRKKSKSKRKRLVNENIEVGDGSSADDFEQKRPATTGVGGGGGGDASESSGGDGEGGDGGGEYVKPICTSKKTKPKYGRTPLTYTRYGSNGNLKRTPDGLDIDETRLYWTLVNWRNKMAKRSHYAYTWMVLNNITLYGVVEGSREDSFLLCDVSGLGGEGKKRRRYGADIIKVLHDHHTNNPR